MNRGEVEERKREVEARYGPWISHNLELGHGLYTIASGVAGGNETRLRRVVQLLSDFSPKSLDELRVLDLGAFEGLFAVELARRGATVVAIEGREASLEKMRLAKDAHSLSNLELHLADVRDLTLGQFGTFDCILCLGLLYHLDAPDVFMLLETMRSLGDLVIIETRVASYPSARREYKDRHYWGIAVDEPLDAPPLSREALWAAIDNPQSFHLTRSSLANALADCGYSSVLECLLPPLMGDQPNRSTFVALTRPRQEILSVRALNHQPWERKREPAVPLLERSLRRLAFYRWLEPRIVSRLKRAVELVARRARK